MSKRLSREIEAEVRALSAAGVSNRALAKQLGVSHTTIATILKSAAPPPRPPTEPAPAPEDAAPEAPEEPTESTLEWARRSARDSQKIAEEARSVGNYASAQRASRDAAQYLGIIARLEKQHREDGDAIRVSRASVAEKWEQMKMRIEGILARPLLCSQCSRQLSIEWGMGGRKPGA